MNPIHECQTLPQATIRATIVAEQLRVYGDADQYVGAFTLASWISTDAWTTPIGKDDEGTGFRARVKRWLLHGWRMARLAQDTATIATDAEIALTAKLAARGVDAPESRELLAHHYGVRSAKED